MKPELKSALRASLTQPHLWVLIGTTLPPMNVLWAVAFWAFAALFRKDRQAICARCLNVQLTYTLLLALPFLLGERLSKIPGLRQEFAPGSSHALAAGITLGLISALGVLLLVFFNTRAVAENILHHAPAAVPRVKFLRENNHEGTKTRS